MKKIGLIVCILGLLLCGCGGAGQESAEIAATTAPVAQFAREIAQGTSLQVEQLVTDSVSCLHDYSLSVRQMETIARCRLVLISGAGLEDFMADALAAAPMVVDCSADVEKRQLDGHPDPHVWMAPANAAKMAQAISQTLMETYPQWEEAFRTNTQHLLERLEALEQYGQEALANISCREIITFHDGFGYLADGFGLTILDSVEEESGSEASAADLKEIVELVRSHSLPAVFTEVNGSSAAASVIQGETGAVPYALDLAMGGSDYFDAMTKNFDTLKEALQ